MEKLDRNQTAKTSEFHGFRGSNVITGLSFKVRKKIYELFIKEFPEAEKIADVGVTSENISPEANVLEALYPHKSRITAIGIEDAEHLEMKYPGLKFVKINPDEPLPFSDSIFDVVYSHAVIEHIVEPEARLNFLKELVRIGKAAFITTPNKYFLIEPHTFTPLLHFIFPKLFYFLIDKKIINKFYSSQNLKLLDERDFKHLAVQFPDMTFEIKKVTLFGFVSNLILILRKKEPVP